MPADTRSAGDAPESPASVGSGVAPLDRHLGGLSRGGLYLLGGGEVDVRHYLSLLYLRAGLRSGERAALVTQVPRDHLLRRLRQWVLDEVGEAWREGRLRVAGYRGGYEQRVRNAGDPDAVFRELDARTGADADRVALVPGRPMWEGALGPMMTDAFIAWARRTPATVWATHGGTEGEGSADERLHHAADGIFRLTGDGRDRTALRAWKATAADPEPATLSLEAVLVEVGERAPGGPPSVVLVRPPEGEPGSSLATIRGWLRDVGELREVTEPVEIVDLLQEDPTVDLVVVLATQESLERSVRACHLASSVGSAPVVAVVEDRVRASDRAHLIRAGADECLSGPVNLAELASRLERLLPGTDLLAAEDGEGAPSADGELPEGIGEEGVLAEEEFRRSLARRLSRRPAEVFTVVRLPRTALPDGPEERLREAVRLEDGDFVGSMGDSVTVFLAGTSPDEAEGFLDRLASSYGGVADHAELLGSVQDVDRLRRLAGDG